jgi:hypothetical protein
VGGHLEIKLEAQCFSSFEDALRGYNFDDEPGGKSLET